MLRSTSGTARCQEKWHRQATSSTPNQSRAATASRHGGSDRSPRFWLPGLVHQVREHATPQTTPMSARHAALLDPATAGIVCIPARTVASPALWAAGLFLPARCPQHRVVPAEPVPDIAVLSVSLPSRVTSASSGSRTFARRRRPLHCRRGDNHFRFVPPKSASSSHFQ